MTLRPPISFTLPFALPSLNTRQRTNRWDLTKQRNQLILEVIAAIGGPRYFPHPPFRRARVTVSRRSSGMLDPDAVAATCKPLLDALCVSSPRHPGSLGIITDDDNRHLELVAHQSSAALGEGLTVVLIEELEPLPPLPVRLTKPRTGPPKKAGARSKYARVKAMHATGYWKP